MKSLICAAILSLFFVGLSNGDEPSSRNPFGNGVGKQQWQKPQPKHQAPKTFPSTNSSYNRSTRSNYNTQPRVIYQYNYRPNFYQYNFHNPIRLDSVTPIDITIATEQTIILNNHITQEDIINTTIAP